MTQLTPPPNADALKAPPLPPLQDRVSFLVHRINAHLMRITNPMLTRWGVDLTESRLMVALLERGEMSAGEVVALMALPQSTVSHQLKRLERLGYITRHPAKQDQRRIIAKLTKKGRSVAQESNEHSKNVTDELYFAIGENDMDSVRGALKRVDDTLASRKV